MSSPEPLHLFAGHGIELEYMLVARDGLSVQPIADVILSDAAGAQVNEVGDGAIAWSNELALHVIEVKTANPEPVLDDRIAAEFTRALERIDALAAGHGARLLPGAMHPTMEPARDARLWPHDNRSIYDAYDRIFGCQGHGWANLQSCHLNLPFCGDDEFGVLHAAVRAVLPLLPALAASSPMMDGVLAPELDARLAVYRTNQRRLPSIIGAVIPEPVWTYADYQARVLAPMYRDIAPYDREGVLQHEWLNSRGAIARFERNTIEIRVLDVQEHPAADLAICRLVTATIRALVEQRFVDLDRVRALPTAMLAELLGRTIAHADQARVDDPTLLATFGASASCTAGELWAGLADALLWPDLARTSALGSALAVILEHGPLARRLGRALGASPSAGTIDEVYQWLAVCLLAGHSFCP